MPRTGTEELLKQIKRSNKSQGLLVPKIELFMSQNQIEIDDDEDRQFLQDLIVARSRKREKGVYSPSMLSSCVRQVFFVKTGVPGQRAHRTEANGIFHDGNFRHFKWQYLMWKMHRAGIIQLVDVGSTCIGTEIPVGNVKGDYKGTLDNIILLPTEDLIILIDWKGMNGNGFNRALSSGPSTQYAVQSVGYAGLANSSLQLGRRIDDILIIGENKNGPVQTRLVKSPLGLYEWRIAVADYQPLVAKRLKTLRSFERREEIPPPECISTRQMKFRDCPFSPRCRAEVEAIEKKKWKLTKKKPKKKVQFVRKRK